MEKKLIWHDSEVSSWWKSRSQNDGLCFALAQDNVTDHILVMVKDLANLEYKVIASIPHSSLKDTKAAMDEAKSLADKWINSVELSKISFSVRKWRVTRNLTIFFKELPFFLILFASTAFISFTTSIFCSANNYAPHVTSLIAISFSLIWGIIISLFISHKFQSNFIKPIRSLYFTLSVLFGSFVGWAIVLFLFVFME